MRENPVVRYSVIYFFSLLISGLLYSFVTGKLIQLNAHNSLLILLLASILDLLLMFLLNKTRLLTWIPIRAYSLVSLLCFFIFLLMVFIDQGILPYLFLYVGVAFATNCLLLFLQEQLLEQELNLASGFFTMQLLRNFSKMVGFFVGILLSQVHSNTVFFIILLGLLAINMYWTYGDRYSIQEDRVFSKEKVRGLFCFFISGIFVTAIVLWIPLLTKTLLENGLQTISWLPFLLPGILSIALITLQKRCVCLFESVWIEYLSLFLFLI